MIDLAYFTEYIRCHRDGRVEKYYKRSCRYGRKGWNVVPNTANHDGYNHIDVNGKKVKRHRMIAFCFHGLDIDDPTEKVDHINRDTIGNSADNLRVVTQQQNNFNRGAKGYSWDKNRDKWEAYIHIDGKKIRLGLFDEEQDARQAYLDAKEIYHVIPTNSD